MATKIPLIPGQTELDPGQNWQTSAGTGEGAVTSLAEGHQRNTTAKIFQDFNAAFGRNPSQTELGQLLPTYMSATKNDYSAGTALVSQMANSLQNTPTNIANQQQQQALDAYNKNPGQYDSQMAAAFQQATGRDPTQGEKQHFGALLASGQIDQYGMGQLIGQTAEAQNYQTKNYQDQLSNNLQSTQSDYYQKYILPSVLSQTAATGRDPNSSGVQQAAVQAAQQQNYGLQQYLAQFGAGQYGQSAQNQQGMYQAYLSNLYGMQNANVNQQLGQQAYLQQNNTNLMNYQMQQNAYNQYLQNYGQRGSMAQGALAGGASGAMIGGQFGGGWGALAGGLAGAGLGAYGSSRNAATI